MKFNTALRPQVNRRLEEIEHADLVAGIPCFNSDSTIAHVIQMVSEGISRYYRNLKSVIIVSDGGSTDDTREVAEAATAHPFIEKIVAIRDQLALIYLETLNNNFGNAQRMSTQFFDALRQISAETQDVDLKGRLSDMLGARDEVTTALAKADTKVSAKIQTMLADLHSATQKYK